MRFITRKDVVSKVAEQFRQQYQSQWRGKIHLIKAIESTFPLIDSQNINHPYWTYETAVLMAESAMATLCACELPQEE